MFQSTSVINVIGCSTNYDRNISWNSHRSEDDSGIEIPSFSTETRRLTHFGSGFKDRHRINFAAAERSNSFKLIRGKIQKKMPYSLMPTRRKSHNEIRLPPIQRGLTRYTKIMRRGNCIYIGKAASMALESGEFG